ncbi:MAG: DNA polymerase III subunit epsilon [Sphingomonadales bacterium]|nr:DNA polymerase III subunit epsilon [Sphingomonadales bacterium]
MREIVLDTETTGLSPAGGDRMVEIGCIEMINRCETGREFHAYFHPERPMPSEAEAVHGLSDVFLSDKPKFPERADELLVFIGDAPLIAHNAGFDFGFLNHELERCGRDPVCLSRMICTLVLARSKHPGAKHSLDALCTRFGVDRSQRIKHGALLDPLTPAERPVRPARPHFASDEEISRHRAFVARLTQPLWERFLPAA